MSAAASTAAEWPVAGPGSVRVLDAATRDRQRWLATLAAAPESELLGYAANWSDWPTVMLREPEAGLVMLRGRQGGTGDRFNLGEATVTRCVLRCEGQPQSTVGVGYVLGRSLRKAWAVALFDGLLQQDAHRDRMLLDLISPLAQEQARQQAQAAASVAATRVHFTTLQPELTR